MKCPRCNNASFWTLSTGQKECIQCGLRRYFKTQKLINQTRISAYWKWRLIEFFALGVPVYRLRFQVPYSQKTINKWYHLLRQTIYRESVNEFNKLSGKLEMDETMFGGKRPGKRGWGAAGKVIVFGIYKRNGRVLTVPIQSRETKALKSIINHCTKPGSLYYTDDWHAYTYLSVRGNHVVITKDKGVPKGRDHINGIEGFWSYAKHWLRPYRGVPKKYFHLYLKEIEWRFNHRNENLIPLLKNLLNQRIVKE